MLRTFVHNTRHSIVFTVESCAFRRCSNNSFSVSARKIPPNLTSFPCHFQRKYVHCSAQNRRKYFAEVENGFAAQFLPNISSISAGIAEKHNLTKEKFESILNQNYRQSTASEILAAFEQVKEYCIEARIDLSDRRFDRLVDGLMDHCEKLTDVELLKLLAILKDFPQTDSINSHNFADVWSCLDDICCWKLSKWSLETSFTFAHYWFALNLGRVSDFIYELVDRTPRKLKHFNRELLLHACFYHNICRKKALEFDMEHAIAKSVKGYTVDELGIVAMAYFKTQSKVKLPEILSEMARKVKVAHKTVHEISVASILKTLRLSQKFIPELDGMLDALQGEIPRFSNACCVHIALIGTTMQYKHDATLRTSSLRILKDLEHTRLKDIERILLANAMFDFDPGDGFYNACFEQLHTQERLVESAQYTRCLPSALNFLSIRNLYSAELMNRLLSEEYIVEVFGKAAKLLPRELLCLDVAIDVEVEGYEGHRLSKDRRHRAAKWASEYTPTRDQWKTFSPYDKFYLELVDRVVEVVGGREMVAEVHALPQYSKSDIIMCKDRKTGNFVKPFGFEDYTLGDIYRPSKLDQYDWYALVLLVPNTALRNTSEPLGIMKAKERQLKKIGYKPFFVSWNEFLTLDGDGKIDLIRAKLDDFTC